MNIWYLHGFRSTPNGNKVELLKQYFPQYQVTGIEYSPHSPVQAANTLSQALNNLPENEKVLLIGTSLGGFWSRWAAESFNQQGILINPSLMPGKSLPLGSFATYSEQPQQIEVTQADLDAFEDYQVLTPNGDNCQVFLAMDDEVINSQQSFTQLCHHYSIHTFPTGSHRFNQFELLIRNYLQPQLAHQ
jgi:uncharacterized protein